METVQKTYYDRFGRVGTGRTGRACDEDVATAPRVNNAVQSDHVKALFSTARGAGDRRSPAAACSASRSRTAAAAAAAAARYNSC